MNKFITAAEAASKVKDGMTIMVGGFLGNGSPEHIIDEIVKTGVKNLDVIVNDSAFPDKGVGKLIVSGQIKHMLSSHVGTNPRLPERIKNGDIKLDLCPQGTLIERIRAKGAGLGGVLTPVGVGTIMENGKQTLVINGKKYILELPVGAEIAFIKATVGDESGNLIYKGTTQNFNLQMATAADLVIAEVDEIVPVGALAPESIHTPNIFVDYIVKNN